MSDSTHSGPSTPNDGPVIGMDIPRSGGDEAAGINEEEFAPLKRNHACLQCKKRKVKCDGTKPVCSPCMRSHAHAIRSAKRNKTEQPKLCCEWAEGGDEDESPGNGGVGVDVPGALKGGAKRRKHGDSVDPRDEDRDALLARIADLEAKLSELRTGLPRPKSRDSGLGSMSSASGGLHRHSAGATIADIPDMASGVNNVGNGASGIHANTGGDMDGLAEFLMVPSNWPKGLPAPYLLEHLIETFFNQVPFVPRILQRGLFMARARLPPTSPDFPHIALLHAVCAAAAPFTAWVNSLPPYAIEPAVRKQMADVGHLENIEDFALSQAEFSLKAVKQTMTGVIMGPGREMFEMCQATVILTDVHFLKGLPLQGWLLGGYPARLGAALELNNKQTPMRFKPPIWNDPVDSIDREIRLGTVWTAFVQDVGFSLNSCWETSWKLEDLHCALPGSYAEFKRGNKSFPINPQTAHSMDLYISHPVVDPFVLFCKVAVLCDRANSWIKKWHQRDIVPGDREQGPTQDSFQLIMRDIYAFQSTMPESVKNLYRLVQRGVGYGDNANVGLDTSIVGVHIMPNMSICLMYEPFIDWTQPNDRFSSVVRRALDEILGVLHLIPSNSSVGGIFTGFSAFTLFTGARLIAQFIQRDIASGNFSGAARLRADLGVFQSMIDRYSDTHALGLLMSAFLTQFLQAIAEAPANRLGKVNPCPRPMTPSELSKFLAQKEQDVANSLAGSTGPSPSSGAPSNRRSPAGGAMEPPAGPSPGRPVPDAWKSAAFWEQVQKRSAGSDVLLQQSAIVTDPQIADKVAMATFANAGLEYYKLYANESARYFQDGVYTKAFAQLASRPPETPKEAGFDPSAAAEQWAREWIVSQGTTATPPVSRLPGHESTGLTESVPDFSSDNFIRSLLANSPAAQAHPNPFNNFAETDMTTMGLRAKMQMPVTPQTAAQQQSTGFTPFFDANGGGTGLTPPFLSSASASGSGSDAVTPENLFGLWQPPDRRPASEAGPIPALTSETVGGQAASGSQDAFANFDGWGRSRRGNENEKQNRGSVESFAMALGGA